MSAVKIIATGGTIAGEAATSAQSAYTSGQVGVDALIKAVPTLSKIARVSGEQISNVGSQDMSDEIWLKLAKRINQLAESGDVDGIAITHGTDTMEETAYFLHLAVKTKKPVVLTGSMRPSTALKRGWSAQYIQRSGGRCGSSRRRGAACWCRSTTRFTALTT